LEQLQDGSSKTKQSSKKPILQQANESRKLLNSPSFHEGGDWMVETKIIEAAITPSVAFIMAHEYGVTNKPSPNQGKAEQHAAKVTYLMKKHGRTLEYAETCNYATGGLLKHATSDGYQACVEGYCVAWHCNFATGAPCSNLVHGIASLDWRLDKKGRMIFQVLNEATKLVKGDQLFDTHVLGFWISKDFYIKRAIDEVNVLATPKYGYAIKNGLAMYFSGAIGSVPPVAFTLEGEIHLGVQTQGIEVRRRLAAGPWKLHNNLFCTTYGYNTNYYEESKAMKMCSDDPDCGGIAQWNCGGTKWSLCGLQGFSMINYGAGRCTRQKPKSCDERVSGHMETGYAGCQDKSTSGKSCMPWSKYPGFSADGNYCRNPDTDGGGIWCFVPGSWEYCNPLPSKIVGPAEKKPGAVESAYVSGELGIQATVYSCDSVYLYGGYMSMSGKIAIGAAYDGSDNSFSIYGKLIIKAGGGISQRDFNPFNLNGCKCENKLKRLMGCPISLISIEGEASLILSVAPLKKGEIAYLKGEVAVTVTLCISVFCPKFSMKPVELFKNSIPNSHTWF